MDNIFVLLTVGVLAFVVGLLAGWALGWLHCTASSLAYVLNMKRKD